MGLNKFFDIYKKLPKSGNKFYNTKSNGGYSLCVKGKPTQKVLNVLANCVGYACGRFNEVYSNLTNFTGMKYPELYCNAENFIEKAQKIGLEVVNYPVVGGIMVWQKGETLSGKDGAGHVAFVEDIYEDGSIYTSESGYNSKAFWNTKRTNKNGKWGAGKGYSFRGCIVNPAIGDIHYEEPKPVEPPKPNEPVQPVEPPKPIEPEKPTSITINLEDTVIVNGVGCASSDGTGAKTKRFENTKMKVIGIANSTNKPYRYALNQYNKGKAKDWTAVTGWFREEDITK